MKVRILSAIIVLIVVIGLVWLGGYPFAIGMGVLSILGYKEILDLKKSHKEIPNIVKIIGLISLVYLVLGNYGRDALEIVYYPKVILPIIALLIPTVFYQKDKYNTDTAFYLIGVIYLLGLVFNSLIIIENTNVSLLIYLISIAFICDTFAYLIGLLIGKHKMCPKISPAKTWEGAIGGFIATTIICMIIYVNLLGNFSINSLLLTMLLAITVEIGDLIFSKIKRENDIKDFSNLIPGHGGILDRIDSLSFVILAYLILRIIL